MITAITDNLFTWYSGHIEWNVHILLNGMLELNMNSSPCIDLLGQWYMYKVGQNFPPVNLCY